jgi:hypothetical protein
MEVPLNPQILEWRVASYAHAYVRDARPRTPLVFFVSLL